MTVCANGKICLHFLFSDHKHGQRERGCVCVCGTVPQGVIRFLSSPPASPRVCLKTTTTESETHSLNQLNQRKTQPAAAACRTDSDGMFVLGAYELLRMLPATENEEKSRLFEVTEDQKIRKNLLRCLDCLTVALPGLFPNQDCGRRKYGLFFPSSS